MNQQTVRDPFLQKLMQQSTMEEPSDDFTLKLMSMIQLAEIPEKESVKKGFAMIYIYGLLALMLVIAFYAAISFFPQYFTFINTANILVFIKPYLSIFNTIFTFIKAQPIVSIVVFSLAGLFILDKILSLLFHSKMQHT
jgi:hypothetical protein